MKIYLLITCILISGCASFQLEKIDLHKIKIDMASVNKVLRGRLYRGELKNDLSNMTLSFYLEDAKAHQASSEKEYFDFIESQKPEFQLRASKKDFVVCLKASTVKVVLCDIATTAMTDFESTDVEIMLDQKILEFKID